MNLLLNGLVRELLPTSQSLLCARCTEVQLEVGEILGSPALAPPYVYFLTDATVALVVRDASHPHTAGLAVGLVGSEGAVGLQQALGLGTGVLTLEVQTGGSAWRIDAAVLARMAQRNGPLLLAVGRYLWTVSQEVAAMAARAQMHEVHQRLAAWIVLSATRGDARELFLTHAHLADMLGVRRASVTEAALYLKDLGLLEYQRGQIHILNLAGLQAVAQ